MYKYFPSLTSSNFLSQNSTKNIYCDNAGGSQVPQQVIDQVTKMLTNYYIQPYANNSISKGLTSEIEKCLAITNIILNNKEGYIIYGSSTTQLIYNLANSIKKSLLSSEGNIVIADFNHEAMISPFVRISDNTLSIKWWKLKNITKNETNIKYKIDYQDLYNIIDDKTKLVIIPHVSNILGNILDIKNIVREIRTINSNTKILVDGVAYMAHGIIDVIDMDVDFYCVSFYKFCGLRISALYIKDTETIKNIENQNHIFIDKQLGDETTKKLELGGINYENLMSIIGIQNYLCDVAKFFNYKESLNTNKSPDFTRDLLEFVMEKLYIYEKIFINMINNNIRKSNEIEIIDDINIKKTPLFSITFKNYDVKYVETILNALNIICKASKFYSDRLLNNIEKGDVLRISLMHYNNPNNVDRIIHYLNIFVKLDLDFIFNLNSKANNFVTDLLKKSFNNLDKDNYYKENRKRAYSLLDIKDIENINIVGDVDFYQSRNYNNFNGGLTRKYSNIDKSILSDKIFKFLIKTFKQQISDVTHNTGKNYCVDYIFIHQIRVYASDNNVNPVPEGIHRDGYNIIGLCVIDRKNIQGGITNIYDNEKNIILTRQLLSGDIIILNDSKLYHDVTPIKLDKNDKEGYRDIFVFTTIS